MDEKKKGFDLAAALGSVSKMDTPDGREKIEYIKIKQIRPDERNFYSLDGVEELAANIEMIGLQQPLRVRPDPEAEGVYVVVSGHRRLAALTKLYDEGKLDEVACIVEQPPAGAADEVDVMLQELRLIYANSDTRTMTSADISKQAEKVETLLYRLKEAGAEFPGRMRDHVAEVCKVKASKLGRLKVIREKLIPELQGDWEAGDLNESVAYVFAQQPAEVQIAVVRLMSVRAGKVRKYWTEGNTTARIKEATKELKLKKGPSGICDGCDRHDQRLDRLSSSESRYNDNCGDGKCCHGCPNLGTCFYACPHLADEVAKAQEKAKMDRASEKADKEKENARMIAPKVKFWKRFGEARAAAGLSFEEYAKKANVVAFRREKKVEAFERGEKLTPSSGGLPYTGGDGVDEWRIEPLIKAANALGCSVDYLLCRTDVREMAKATPAKTKAQAADPAGPASPRWYPGEQNPSCVGPYLCKLDAGGGNFTIKLIWEGKKGGGWLLPAGRDPVPGTVIGWWPLPADG